MLLFSSPFARTENPPEITLVLENIRPLDHGHRGNLYLTLRHAEAGPVFAAAADYNERSENEVQVLNWDLRGMALKAELRIRIGPDGARRGRAHFPTPADVFVLKLEAQLSATDWAPIRPDREAFLPVWRKDTPLVAGKIIRGTYAGTFASEGKGEPAPLGGAVGGAWRPAARRGWSAVGPAWVEAGDAGVLLKAFLPEQERVDGIDAWAEWSTQTLLQNQAPRLAFRVSSSVPHLIAVSVQSEAGWFGYSPPLRSAPEGRSHSLLLHDFGSRWRPFQGKHLLAVRVGVIDGSGAGEMELRIQDLQIFDEGAPVEPAATPLVTVVVRPESTRMFNGSDEIPPGLFGFHDVNESQPRAANEGEPDAVEMMRQLRPGLLRPLTHTTFGLASLPDQHLTPWAAGELRPWTAAEGVWAQRVDAADARGRVIWTHTADLWARPPWMDVPMEEFLAKIGAYYAQLATEAWSPEHPERLLRDLEVWNEPFMWGRHINMGFRRPVGVKDVVDETQYGYIPGKVGAEAWSALFLAASRGAKAVNPHLRLGGPSAPDFAQHDYRDFRNYTLRILETVGNELDFITEHHYGGNPLITAAGYDVARSALRKLHGRVIPLLTTEANDLGASDAGKALWNLVDILHLIRTQPDMAQGRALHACWNGYLNNRGEEHAWRLMAPLRGKIIDMDVDTPRLTAVAAHPAPGSLVVVGADHGVGPCEIRFPMPPGFRVREVLLLLAEAPAAENALRDVDGAGLPDIPLGKTALLAIAPQVEQGFLRFPLPARSAFRVTFHRPQYQPSRVRRQSYTPFSHLFTTLQAGETLSLAVERKIEPDRLYLRSVYTGNLRLLFEGHPPVDLPPGPARSADAELLTHEIPPELLLLKPRLEAGPGGAEILSVGWVMEE